MSFTIYFVRHGQTFLNHYRRMQGWCDSPLTPKGIEDGHRAGRHLAHINFSNVYHSDTTRAKRTCGYIIDENVASAELPQPKILRNFREQSYGYFEGNDSSQTWLMVGAIHGCETFEELITKYSIEKSRDFMKETDPFHDAENDAEYWTRINAGFDYLRTKQKSNDKVLLVSHGTTIRSIVHRFAPNIDIVSEGPANGSVTKMTVDKNNVKVEYYNHYLDEQTY